LIAVTLLVLILLLLAATPWRRLPVGGQVWAVVAMLNAMVFFTLPTTPATSPWRSVVGRALATCAVASFALLVLGLILRKRHAAGGGAGGAWVGPLILGALPMVLYTFFRVVGPLY
jgi:hypothetical protein